MRDKLKNISEENYWMYGLSGDDLDHVFRLVKKYVSLGRAEADRQLVEAMKKYPDPDVNCEITSDIGHYTWCEEQYLWEFCLGRLQGIFEALLMSRHINSVKYKKLYGLLSKVSAARECGFTITEEQMEELRNWNILRNALSHAPPERYRPVPLLESDVSEYMMLIKKILSDN